MLHKGRVSAESKTEIYRLFCPATIDRNLELQKLLQGTEDRPYL